MMKMLFPTIRLIADPPLRQDCVVACRLLAMTEPAVIASAAKQSRRRPPDGLNSRLLLGVFAQPLADILGAKDVAGRIRRDTFAARLVVVRVGARDEVFDRPVLGIADPDAAPAARIGSAALLVLGLRVRDIDHVVLVDEHRTRPAELLPLDEELAVRVEDLDA